MPTSVPPTKADPSSVLPPKRPALTQEQFSKLALLLQHLNADTLTLPDNVKDVRDAQKKRLKQNRDPKSWVGQPVQGSGQRGLSDTEKCWLSSERGCCSTVWCGSWLMMWSTILCPIPPPPHHMLDNYT